jgi:glycosyltransferase involved in cell wall biosynthesis
MSSSLPQYSAWICSQIGAREHFAVPQALHQTGRLAALYTDFWAGPTIRKLGVGRLRPLAARFHSELGKAEKGRQKTEIVSWNFRSLWWEWHLRRRAEGGNLYLGFIEVGSRFAVRVREALKRRPDLKPDSTFFAYDTGALETLKWCREQGIKCILNQMDPNRVEVELVRFEEKQWPGWALEAIKVPEQYFARREQEWFLADRVVVNSEFSRQALLQQGVLPEKLAVVPLCFETKIENSRVENGNQLRLSALKFSPSSPLKVLFLGQVILRKGIQYLLAAARQLERENIHFDVVGPIGISREAMATAPGNVTFHGRTGRDHAAVWYRQSHLFVVPTLSDGFAITQLEAMAYGLPVISTACCGEVVNDGMDGFVVPARDAGALARTFQRYLAQPELLSSQSAAALLKARQFTLDRLAANLTCLETSLRA